MNKLMKTILIIILIVVLLLLVLSWFLAAFTVSGKRQTLKEAMDWQSDHYDTSFYDALEKTAYTVPGEGGYLLHAEYLKNPEQTDRFIILSHGYTDNRIGSLKYVRMYLDLGFNCIIYDLRGHGENDPFITTYGILEGKDLALLAEDTRTRYPGISLLGLHGESLGASSTISALKYHPQVDFAVSDCGFSDIENVLRTGYASAHVPAFLFDLADIGVRIRYHYSLRDMRPIDSLEGNRIPILFIHGADDRFILPENARNMAERTAGPRDLILIPGAGHAESILTDPETYQQAATDFLNKFQ